MKLETFYYQFITSPDSYSLVGISSSPFLRYLYFEVNSGSVPTACPPVLLRPSPPGPLGLIGYSYTVLRTDIKMYTDHNAYENIVSIL